MTKKQEIEQFIFEGIITGTSNKQSEEMKTDKPRKSCYISVDEENAEILLQNGLTKYTSKEDKKDFFIIKFSEEIKVYAPEGYFNHDTSTSSDNFSTDDKKVKFACIKGKNMGRNYVRIFALQVNEPSDLVINEVQNPFE